MTVLSQYCSPRRREVQDWVAIFILVGTICLWGDKNPTLLPVRCTIHVPVMQLNMLQEKVLDVIHPTYFSWMKEVQGLSNFDFSRSSSSAHQHLHLRALNVPLPSRHYCRSKQDLARSDPAFLMHSKFNLAAQSSSTLSLST